MTSWIDKLSGMDLLIELAQSGLWKGRKTLATSSRKCACGNIATRYSQRCGACRNEDRQYLERQRRDSQKLDGNLLRVRSYGNKCRDCGVPLTYYSSVRCMPCHRLSKPRIVAHCIDCGIRLTDYRAKRCKPHATAEAKRIRREAAA
jgi:hypothetical protein